jgi:transketolase
VDAAARRGYILAEGTDRGPVHIAPTVPGILLGEGISTRAVSAPCVEWFTAQDASYQEEARRHEYGFTAGRVAAARPGLGRLNANARSEEP